MRSIIIEVCEALYQVPVLVAQAFVKAKEQGKVRHICFTGHHAPGVHQRLFRSFDGWETVKHPVNLIDQHHLSFIDNVLPKVRAKGLGMLAMKKMPKEEMASVLSRTKQGPTGRGGEKYKRV